MVDITGAALKGLIPGASRTLRALRGLVPSALVMPPSLNLGGAGAPYLWPPQRVRSLASVRQEEEEVFAAIASWLQIRH